MSEWAAHKIDLSMCVTNYEYEKISPFKLILSIVTEFVTNSRSVFVLLLVLKQTQISQYICHKAF